MVHALVRRRAVRRLGELLGVAALLACQSAPPRPVSSGPPPSGSPPSGPAADPVPPVAVVPVAAAPAAVVPAAAAPAAAPHVLATAPAAAQLAALEPLICFGNEPFWGVMFKADGSATCEAMCEGPPGLHVVNVSLAPGGDAQGFDLLDAQGGLFLRGVLRKTGKCSDGMSDNLHPYVFTGEGQRALTGCCRDKRVQLTGG